MNENALGLSVAASRTTAVVDLFCGAGGLTYGLKSAGLTVKTGVDLDPACRHPIEQNTEAAFECRDVADVTVEELERWFGEADIRVLAGCAPCQPFSTYSQSRKSVDERWKLLTHFQRLAIAVRPEVVTMENVPGLASQTVWKEFVEALREAGYHVSWSEVACEEYGIPQSRRRLVLLASLLGPIELARPVTTGVMTVKDAISDLPALKAGASSKEDPLHTSSTLTPTNIQRIQASVPGGTWRDWPEDLRAACHRKKTGKTYPSVYGRMEWEKPAPTMTTQCYGFGNGRFGHPDQDRAISLREAAIIQSFPKTYSFLEDGEKVTFSRLGILIGNAVPPRLGEAIGRSILSHIEALENGQSEHKGQLELL